MERGIQCECRKCGHAWNTDNVSKPEPVKANEPDKTDGEPAK